MALYDVSTTEKKTSPELVAGGTLYADNPLGTILPFGSATIPTGWLLCDGTAISRTTYSELFAVIGTAFGSGDGSTTFNVPDLRGKVPVGFNTSETEFNALGNTGGEKTHILTVSEMPSHSHYMGSDYSNRHYGAYGEYIDASSGSYRHTQFNNASSAGALISTSNTGGGTAHNNLQPYNTVNYIIKAKMTAVPADFMSVVDEAVEDVYGDIIPSDASASNQLVTESDISETKDIVSDAWNSSKTYAAGEYCISGNKLYKCLVANTGTQPPNTTYWEETTCAEEFSELNSNLTNAVSTLNSNLTNVRKNLSDYVKIVSSNSRLEATGQYTWTATIPNGYKPLLLIPYTSWSDSYTKQVSCEGYGFTFSNGVVTINSRIVVSDNSNAYISFNVICIRDI